MEPWYNQEFFSRLYQGPDWKAFSFAARHNITTARSCKCCRLFKSQYDRQYKHQVRINTFKSHHSQPTLLNSAQFRGSSQGSLLTYLSGRSPSHLKRQRIYPVWQLRKLILATKQKHERTSNSQSNHQAFRIPVQHPHDTVNDSCLPILSSLPEQKRLGLKEYPRLFSLPSGSAKKRPMSNHPALILEWPLYMPLLGRSTKSQRSITRLVQVIYSLRLLICIF